MRDEIEEFMNSNYQWPGGVQIPPMPLPDNAMVGTSRLRLPYAYACTAAESLARECRLT